ncbi:MAG: hypothetical protein JOY62_01755 [Acidobacteriaceae bacterium]|nr:hypothetical protein [Acidobacteriaceae bacterium]
MRVLLALFDGLFEGEPSGTTLLPRLFKPLTFGSPCLFSFFLVPLSLLRFEPLS